MEPIKDPASRVAHCFQGGHGVRAVRAMSGRSITCQGGQGHVRTKRQKSANVRAICNFVLSFFKSAKFSQYFPNFLDFFEEKLSLTALFWQIFVFPRYVEHPSAHKKGKSKPTRLPLSRSFFKLGSPAAATRVGIQSR